MSESVMRIRSAESDAAVEFSDVDADAFRVDLIAHDHAARRRVYAHTDGRGIVRLFAEAARDWRGWEEAGQLEGLAREAGTLWKS